MTEEGIDFFRFLLQREPWQEEAACRDSDTSLFFLEKGQSPLPAKAICRTCPVTSECEDYAERTHSDYGVWAGTTRNPQTRLSQAS